MFIIESKCKLVIHATPDTKRKQITGARDDRIADDIGPAPHRCGANVRFATGRGRIPDKLMSGPKRSGIIDTIDLYGTPVLWCLSGLQRDGMVRAEQVGVLQRSI